jgi:hypothetical protein
VAAVQPDHLGDQLYIRPSLGLRFHWFIAAAAQVAAVFCSKYNIPQLIPFPDGF